MTPQELFDSGPMSPQWVHGADIGVDENGGLWVRAEAKLKSDLGPRSSDRGVRVTTLAEKNAPSDFREFSILTYDRKTGLDPRHRTEPVWRQICELESGSIGAEWVAVN